MKKTLRQLRIESGLTQKQLADRLERIGRGSGLQGTVNKMESGRNSPTVGRLKAFLDAAGLELVMHVRDVETGELSELCLASLVGIVKESTARTRKNTQEGSNE
jgi:transcriptional regulator with XRE-family HTH domain